MSDGHDKIFSQKLILASQSPRRAQLLKQVGFDFEINKNVTAGPFVQYVTDKDWEKQETLFGTSISVKF